MVDCILDVVLVLNAGDTQTHVLGIAIASLLLLVLFSDYISVAAGIVAFGLASYLHFFRRCYRGRALVLMGLFYVALKKSVLTLFIDLGFQRGPVQRALAALFNVDITRFLF